jgi:hypothetical protein
MKRYRVILLSSFLIGLAGCASGIRFTPIGGAGGDLLLDDEELEAAEAGGEIANLVGGEKLTYDASWIGIAVGRLILENHGLEVVGGEEAYHLTFTTVSNEFLSNFFKIEDTVHTWISRKEGYPLRFEKVVREGKYTKHEVIEYDRENMTATYRREDKADRAPETMPIPPEAQDVFSMVYWLRRQPIGLGRQLSLSVNADRKNWDVVVEVVEKGLFETIPTGQVKAFAMAPRAAHRGQPLKKGNLLAWVTMDQRRIPLAFEVETPIFGSAVAVLSDAVLPPLEDELPEGEETGQSPERIYLAGDWIRGLTQAVTADR